MKMAYILSATLMGSLSAQTLEKVRQEKAKENVEQMEKSREAVKQNSEPEMEEENLPHRSMFEEMQDESKPQGPREEKL